MHRMGFLPYNLALMTELYDIFIAVMLLDMSVIILHPELYLNCRNFNYSLSIPRRTSKEEYTILWEKCHMNENIKIINK